MLSQAGVRLLKEGGMVLKHYKFYTKNNSAAEYEVIL